MKTILFADDQKNIREYCRAAFAEEGYRVVLARDGIEAIERFSMETPDVAVLDISMPRATVWRRWNASRDFLPGLP